MSDTPLSMHAIEMIKSWIGRRDLNKSELARRLHVSHTWVSNRLAGNQEITLNELEQIAEALEVDVADLLPRPALRRESGETGRRSDTIAYRPHARRPIATHSTGLANHPIRDARTAEPHRVSPVSSRTRTDRPAIRPWRNGGATS